MSAGEADALIHKVRKQINVVVYNHQTVNNYTFNQSFYQSSNYLSIILSIIILNVNMKIVIKTQPQG